jgi:outer membrane receptor for ferrienterochelin and colicins
MFVMRVRTSVLAVTLMFCCAFVSAQTAVAAAPDNARSYVPADFAQFAPRTAYDMLARVPGFSIRQEDTTERGLGQATGNVLINSQRISGKSNDVLTELSRIPAANVQRIEIVDGASLDVPGLTGQVANVIVRSGGISGQFAYRPEFRAYNTDPLFTRFELSASGAAGPVEYTLGLQNSASRSGAGGATWIYDPSGNVIEDRDETWRSNVEQPRVSGRFVYHGPENAIGNLNISYGRMIFDYLETGTRIERGLTSDRARRVTIDEGGHDYEIGTDYEFGFRSGRLKLIGLNRSSHTPSETNVFTTFADGSPQEASRYTGTGDETERIGRGEYRWTSGGAEWQVTGEAAFNSLDNTSRLFELTDGRYEEQELTGATARVSEDRYEVIGTYGRPLSPAVRMKLSAGGEYSQLSQPDTAIAARTFYRPKGELSIAWQPSKGTDLNLKLARRVGQLNFYDFLASVNLRDDIQTAANPDLVPQQSWELDLEGVRNLGRYGTTTVRLYGHLIDDIIDYIPIGEDGEAPGNLDHATVYGIEAKSTINLDSFGWRGARVDAYAQWQDSEVEDPLTGELRPISETLLRAGTLAFRHDVPSTDWAWGGSLQYEYYSMRYRLTEVGRFWEGPVWGDLYLEHKNVHGLTIRAGVHNLLGADSMWDRTVYLGRRTDPVDYVEKMDRRIGPIFAFQIRGKF